MNQHDSLADVLAPSILILVFMTYIVLLYYAGKVRDDVRAICAAVECVEDDGIYREQVLP